MAPRATWCPNAVGTDRAVDITEDYVARVLQDWDGGDRALKVVWDPATAPPPRW
jgi:phosphomannomutase